MTNQKVIDKYLKQKGLSEFSARTEVFKDLIDSEKVSVVDWLDDRYSYHRKREIVSDILHNSSLLNEVVKAYENKEISTTDLTFKYICHCVPGNTSIDQEAFITFEFDLLKKMLELNLLNFNEFIDELSSKSLSTIGKDLRGRREDLPEFCTFVSSSGRYEFGADADRNNLQVLYDLKLIDEDNLKYVVSKINEPTSFINCLENSATRNYVDILGTLKTLLELSHQTCFGCVATFDTLFNSSVFDLYDNLLDDKKRLELREYCDQLLNEGHVNHQTMFYNLEILEHLLSNFKINKQFVDNLNELKQTSVSPSEMYDSIRKAIRESNNFARCFYCMNEKTFTEDQKDRLLQLTELNEKLYLTSTLKFTLEQQHELADIVQNSERSKETLTQILSSNLQDQYSFEQLKNILTKDFEKKKLKMNL